MQFLLPLISLLLLLPVVLFGLLYRSFIFFILFCFCFTFGVVVIIFLNLHYNFLCDSLKGQLEVNSL